MFFYLLFSYFFWIYDDEGLYIYGTRGIFLYKLYLLFNSQIPQWSKKSKKRWKTAEEFLEGENFHYLEFLELKTFQF